MIDYLPPVFNICNLSAEVHFTERVEPWIHLSLPGSVSVSGPSITRRDAAQLRKLADSVDMAWDEFENQPEPPVLSEYGFCPYSTPPEIARMIIDCD